MERTDEAARGGKTPREAERSREVARSGEAARGGERWREAESSRET